MNEKKTVLFLMNGFGVEANKSFEVYSKTLMPTFDKLISAYPFKLLFASGEMIGANKGETSNFQTGFYNFSTFGHPTTKYDILKKKIAANEFLTNSVVNDSIDSAIKNQSRLHIMFTLGNKVNVERYEQLKLYLELAKKKGIKEVYAHLILGDSSVNDLKIGNHCITDFKNRVIRYFPQVKIASICSKKYVKDGSHDEIANFYRMMVSGVGEVWTDYATTINKKYKLGMTDDTMNGFVTIREPLLRENDSLLMFNYSSNIGDKFLKTVLNPKHYFPTSKVPEHINVSSLFSIQGIQNVPYAFENELPETYFLDKIPEDKKVLIIGTKERISYITNCLNGYRPSYKSNVSVWPIEDKAKRFEVTSQYLAAYINQNIYDLIIVDCQLYDPSVDERTIDQIKKNLQELDKCLNITYNRVMDNDYRLIATSLYGIRYTFKLTATMELVDLSQKTPFLLVDKGIRKVDVVFKSAGTFIDVARLIAISFGTIMPNNLIALDDPNDKGKKKSLKKLIILVPIILLLALVAIYVYMMYF